ncbi:hypothetical protein [Janthinobacterium agaricidamnosum]|uniref:Zinc protease n=1 Tax=Janthinobacterium agaricidamnosum NBRC 102515 = DSM 9628 TaxID=1349767 RepID=W0UZF8_9BURK|nr:hypothetical protein [Janthinobacterium agaricidamnosum]CDG81944.1 zinc protease [Janthinobacterium agaricidamnosum NBRC 102515 = DSM 9628]
MSTQARPLTRGETAMARLVFRDAIDYARVRVCNRSYLPFGLQNRHTAITPNGNLYFRDPEYRADFSRDDVRGKLFFMHEMVHVWQWQLGYPVMWRGLCLALKGGYFRRRAYRYDAAAAGRPLSSFNMEQQGDIIAHYFAAQHLGLARYAASLPFLNSVLADFLRAPGDIDLLPR